MIKTEEEEYLSRQRCAGRLPGGAERAGEPSVLPHGTLASRGPL